VKGKEYMRKGFTLIEIIISIALMVILTSVYILVANPAGQLGLSRNSERLLQLQTLMNAIRQNIADQSNEQFSCSAGPIPTSTAIMSSKPGAGNYNIAPCIIVVTGGLAAYGIYTLPFDPSASSSYYNSITDYNTDYTIIQNASGSITLSAPNAELKQAVSITR
jgi:prepilin-type N-terminal cleavage/methylation domain-containing protein